MRAVLTVKLAVRRCDRCETLLWSRLPMVQVSRKPPTKTRSKQVTDARSMRDLAVVSTHRSPLSALFVTTGMIDARPRCGLDRFAPSSSNQTRSTLRESIGTIDARPRWSRRGSTSSPQGDGYGPEEVPRSMRDLAAVSTSRSISLRARELGAAPFGRSAARPDRCETSQRAVVSTTAKTAREKGYDQCETSR